MNQAKINIKTNLALALSHFFLPYHLIFNISSNNQINHIPKNQSNITYVSGLLNKLLFTHHRFWTNNDIPIIINVISIIKPHHIVGVPALCLWSLANIVDFSQVTVSSRIVLPALNFFNNLIYNGYIAIPKANATKANINIWFNFISIPIHKFLKQNYSNFYKTSFNQILYIFYFFISQLSTSRFNLSTHAITNSNSQSSIF